MPISWIDLLLSFALAVWPVWVILIALGVVWLASRLGYMAPDEYEEPEAARPSDKWMTEAEKRYHGDDGLGR